MIRGISNFCFNKLLRRWLNSFSLIGNAVRRMKIKGISFDDKILYLESVENTYPSGIINFVISKHILFCVLYKDGVACLLLMLKKLRGHEKSFERL